MYSHAQFSSCRLNWLHHLDSIFFNCLHVFIIFRWTELYVRRYWRFSTFIHSIRLIILIFFVSRKWLDDLPLVNLRPIGDFYQLFFLIQLIIESHSFLFTNQYVLLMDIIDLTIIFFHLYIFLFNLFSHWLDFYF